MLPAQKIYLDTDRSKDYGPDVPLPAGYTKLDYVVKTGTGKIATGVTYNVNVIAGIKWQGPVSGNSSWPIMFGQYRTNGFSGDYYQSFAFRAFPSIGKFNVYHGLNPNDTYGDAPAIPYITNDSNIHFVELLENSIVVDNIKKTYEEMYADAGYTWKGIDNTKIKTQTIYLFDDAYTGRPSTFKLYNFYLRNNATDTTLRNFVPCKNPSGVVKLYDTVSNTEYTCSTLSEP